jgi:protein ImuB
MAARACARYRDGLVVAGGEEAQILAPLPIEALNLDHVTNHAFRRAGLKTVGQAASRDRRELTARFGAQLVFILETALAKAEKPIAPRLPMPDYRTEQSFAEPVVSEDTIRATLFSLAATLGDVLERRGEGARRLEAAFFRADGEVRRIAVETGAPTREPAMVARLFRERLDALIDPLDPGFGFDLIRLSASRTERCTSEAAGFDAGMNEAREIRFLIDRLAARFGAHRVLALQANDTHVPEAVAVAVPAQYAQAAKVSWAKIRRPEEAPRRPLRLFTKPEPISFLQDVTNQSPLRFRWRRAVHVVKRIEGPERIATEWWRHQEPQPTRDYFRVEDEEGRRFWLYRNGVPGRDPQAPQWLLHGVFA